MMNIKRMLSLLLLLLVCLSLAACSVTKSSPQSSGSPSALSLPIPETNPPAAPYGDQTDNKVYRASIYYASSDGTVSMPSTRVLWINSHSSIERRLAEELLKTPGGDAMMVAPKGSRIASVEAAGPVVTVNVIPSMPLNDSETALIIEAMSKTLLEADGVEGVNTLISGRASEINHLPVGVIQETNSAKAYLDEADHYALSAVMPETMERVVALYYPSASENALLVNSAYVSLDMSKPAESILSALMQPPSIQNALTAIPSVDRLMEKDAVYSLTPSGERILNLYFTSDAMTALTESGHDRQMYLASIVLTLTSFLPETDGVTLTIGGKLVTEVPVKNAPNQKFPSGIMRRSDFAHLIGKNVPLYFADENGMLALETRALPLAAADSPRARIVQLMEGPKSSDLLSIFPDGLKNTDILGVSVSENIVLVNLSANAYRLAQSLTVQEEELFVYGLVNTLSEISGINGVRLYFDGVTGSYLTHRIHLTGVILPNPGRISVN